MKSLSRTRTLIRYFSGIALLLFVSIAVHAQTTTFTYQGRLSDGANPANGSYQMQFALFDAATGGAQQGATLTFDGTGANPAAVTVTNGVFSVQLDFGATAFPGADRYLEISVKKPSDSTYTTLSPRQQITSTPYAIRSLNATTADSATTAQTATNATNATTATTAQTANSATTAQNFTGNLSGDVTGTQSATVVSSVGGQTATNVASGAQAVNNATAANTASTIVKRDASGNFAAGTITATLNGSATSASSATTAATANGVATSAGNSVVGAINDAATSAVINSNRLSGDVVLLNPAATQDAASGNTNTILNLRGNSQNLFQVNLDGGLLATGQYDGGISGGIPAEGAGTRLMWYPNKASFRAGYVTGTQWDDANTGSFSTAFGQDVRASGDNSFAAGYNSVAANTGSVAMGQYTTASGAASVALGYYAHTNARQGSFVFSDRSVLDDGNPATDESFRAGVNNSANWRVVGGFRIFTSSNLSTGITIQSGASTSNWGQANAVISTSTGAYLSTSGVWTDNSSVHLKTNFTALDSRDILRKVLGLRIQSWNYKVDSPNIRHIGVMAQDFYRAFNLGADNEHITAVDTAGVTMAAIQGLHQELKDRDQTINRQQQQINTLQTQAEQQQRQIAELRQAVCALKPDASVCTETGRK